MFLIEVILLIYFGYVSAYSFILSSAGLLLYNMPSFKNGNKRNNIAVFIPAYKEDAVILGVAKAALTQNYPKDLYTVVIIADSLKTETLEQLKKLEAKTIEVSFEKSTKVRALNRAMELLPESYDYAIILDADNIMESDFLNKMNSLASQRFKAIQGNRSPKNENTSIALLDGLSETINNFIYRQGTVSLGMSSSLNGSGMFFDYKILKKTLSEMDSIGGFDRELELKLIEQGVKVYYAKNIVVLDEKVQDSRVFENQRKRWISSQFIYLRKYLGQGLKELVKGNFTYFNSAVLRNIQLPRLLNLGFLLFITALSWVFKEVFNFSPWLWTALFLSNILAMLFAVPKKYYSLKLLKAVGSLPMVFIKMFFILFKLKGANSEFLHTPHHAPPDSSKNV